MKNRYLSIALAIAVGSGFAVAAQTADQQATAPAPAQQRHNPAHQAQAMARKLGLTNDQAAQLQPILAERAQQRMAIQSDQALSRKDRHAQLKTLRQNSDTKIKAVLTDDQKLKYDQMQQEMRQHAHQRRQQS